MGERNLPAGSSFLEYLVAVPGGVGRQHRYLLADPPTPSGSGEPRETPRPVRGGGPRGQNDEHTGAMADPAVRAVALNGNGPGIVGVGTDAEAGAAATCSATPPPP